MLEPNFTCNTCGKEGYKKPSLIKSVGAQYCNQDCFKKRPLKFQTVQCLNCSKFYEKRVSNIARSPNHLCSSECKYSFLSKKIEVSCEYCNKVFQKALYDSKRTNGNFCSRQCSGKSRQEKVYINCSHCSKDLVITPYEQKKTLNHFCDKKCTDNFRKNRQTIKCAFCEKPIERILSRIQKAENCFCSIECNTNYKLSLHIKVNCLVCDKEFSKTQRQIKERPRHCCSKKCTKLLLKFHKDWGSKRSKIELLIEEHLGVIFSTLKIDYNKTEIGYELDIYIPELKLAFEINGPTHYRPIYGEKHFLRTQRVDKEKSEECQKRGIELIIINVSEDKHLSKAKINYRINQVVNYINEQIDKKKKILSVEQLSMEF
jgi:hypothetical protein